MENPAPMALAPTSYDIPETLRAKLSQIFYCTDAKQEEEKRKWLNAAELSIYDDMLELKIRELSQQQEMLMNRLSDIPSTAKNELTRESNQRKIQKAMHRLVTRNGHMPSKSQIAEATGLSRKTVSKHLADSSNSNDMLNELTLMAPHVMNSVLQKVLNEQDMHAARLYMKVTADMLQQQAGRPHYIIIGTTIVSQADIDDMSPAQKAKVLDAINEEPTVDSLAQ